MKLSYPTTSSELEDGTQDDLFRITNNNDEALPYRIAVEKGEPWLSLVNSGGVSVSSIEGQIAPNSAVQVSVRTTFNRLTGPVDEGVVSVAYGPELEFQTKINVQGASLERPVILLSRSMMQFRVTRGNARNLVESSDSPLRPW